MIPWRRLDAIFIQIAAYRDPDLPRTIRSALDQAARPSRLRFGICHQVDAATSTDLDEWRDDRRFSIDSVPSTLSRGVGWARNRAQARYDDEPYLLQIDAHMRFAESWDDRYITMLHSVESERPILTNYPLGFVAGPDGTSRLDGDGSPHHVMLDASRAPGSLRQRGALADEGGRPGRHPFVAAGHLFTVGRFCRDVPYDPDIYFVGEEISLALRAYTHGYDLYYPHEHLLWHWYDHGAPLHWQDHPDHSDLHHRSADRVRRLLQGDDAGFGRYGLGRRRTAEAFEHLVGVPLPPDGYVCAECDHDGRPLAGRRSSGYVAVNAGRGSG